MIDIKFSTDEDDCVCCLVGTFTIHLTYVELVDRSYMMMRKTDGYEYTPFASTITFDDFSLDNFYVNPDMVEINSLAATQTELVDVVYATYCGDSGYQKDTVRTLVILD